MDQWMDSFRRGWRNPWFAGQLLIWIIVVMLSFIVALLLRYTSMGSTTLPAITFFINAVGLLCGGYMAGKRAGQRGWFFGGMQGIIYTLILGLISFLAFDLQMQTSILLFMLSAFGLGALGGIFGVNTGE